MANKSFRFSSHFFSKSIMEKNAVVPLDSDLKFRFGPKMFSMEELDGAREGGSTKSARHLGEEGQRINFDT